MGRYSFCGTFPASRLVTFRDRPALCSPDFPLLGERPPDPLYTRSITPPNALDVKAERNGTKKSRFGQ